MSRRSCILGTGLYLLALNQAPLAELQMALRSGRPQASGFPCSLHACGCLSGEDCRSRCCCFQGGRTVPGDHHQESEPRPERVFASLVGGCSGGPSGAAPNAERIAPHLSLCALPAPRFGRGEEVPAPPGETPASAFRDPPGRVPI